MPITLQPAPHAGMIHAVLTGPWPRLQEQKALAYRLVAVYGTRREVRLMLDARNLTMLPYLDDVRSTMSIINAFSGSCRLAIVVESEAQLGVGRMVEALLPSCFEARVFTDKDEAAGWLVGRGCTEPGERDRTWRHHH